MTEAEKKAFVRSCQDKITLHMRIDDFAKELRKKFANTPSYTPSLTDAITNKEWSDDLHDLLTEDGAPENQEAPEAKLRQYSINASKIQDWAKTLYRRMEEAPQSAFKTAGVNESVRDLAQSGLTLQYYNFIKMLNKDRFPLSEEEFKAALSQYDNNRFTEETFKQRAMKIVYEAPDIETGGDAMLLADLSLKTLTADVTEGKLEIYIKNDHNNESQGEHNIFDVKNKLLIYELIIASEEKLNYQTVEQAFNLYQDNNFARLTKKAGERDSELHKNKSIIDKLRESVIETDDTGNIFITDSGANPQQASSSAAAEKVTFTPETLETFFKEALSQAEAANPENTNADSL